jgi:hypothetical protein
LIEWKLARQAKSGLPPYVFGRRTLPISSGYQLTAPLARVKKVYPDFWSMTGGHVQVDKTYYSNTSSRAEANNSGIVALVERSTGYARASIC